MAFFEFLEAVPKSGRVGTPTKLPRGIPAGIWTLATAVCTSARSAHDSMRHMSGMKFHEVVE